MFNIIINHTTNLITTKIITIITNPIFTDKKLSIHVYCPKMKSQFVPSYKIDINNVKNIHSLDTIDSLNSFNNIVNIEYNTFVININDNFELSMFSKRKNLKSFNFNYNLLYDNWNGYVDTESLQYSLIYTLLFTKNNNIFDYICENSYNEHSQHINRIKNYVMKNKELPKLTTDNDGIKYVKLYIKYHCPEIKTQLQKSSSIKDFLSILFTILMYYITLVTIVLAYYFPKTTTLLYYITSYLKMPKLNDSILSSYYKKISNYFDHTVVYDSDISSDIDMYGKYIKCFMPHGVVPFGFSLYKSYLYDNEFNVNYNYNNNNTMVVSNVMFRLPFVKQFVELNGAKDANKDTIMKILSSNKSPMIYIGGIPEIFLSNKNTEVLYIKKRKGIFNISIKTKTPLLPIYSFGITHAYDKISNYPIYHGRFNTLFPYKIPILTIIGNPIYPGKGDTCETLKSKYIFEIQRLFNKNKHLYNWHNKKLVIV